MERKKERKKERNKEIKKDRHLGKWKNANELPQVGCTCINICYNYYRDGLGKEIISRFNSDLSSDSVWYTDANGREMQKRK